VNIIPLGYPKIARLCRLTGERPAANSRRGNEQIRTPRNSAYGTATSLRTPSVCRREQRAEASGQIRPPGWNHRPNETLGIVGCAHRRGANRSGTASAPAPTLGPFLWHADSARRWPALGIGSFVIRRSAASIAVKATAKFSQNNLESDGNEVDTNILVALMECSPGCLRKLHGSGLSAFGAF
jgi:hypothetical protein